MKTNSKARVIVTKESSSGRNIKFKDTVTNQEMSRAGFVKKIENNENNYKKSYTTKMINGLKTPVSKPDSSKKNNLN